MGLEASPPELRLSVPTAPVAACTTSGQDLLTAALAARPDVRAAELQIEAAGARAGLERAKTLALTATIDMNFQGQDGFEAGPGLAVELPIFSQNQGGRARAAAELMQATRRYQALQATVATAIDGALINLQEARDMDALFGADLSASLAREGEQAQHLYEAGEISLLALLDVRRRLNDVELSRVDIGLAVARARARLEQAVGQSCEAE
jgi:cobalt-zinc-cadmium efflux system outer membrane protein